MPIRQRNTVAGFTLIELLVVISIIALLIAILLPALESARASARQMACLSLVRQFNLANAVYADTYQGAYLPIMGANVAEVWVPTTPWVQNDAFGELLGVDAGWEWDPRFICPDAESAIADAPTPGKALMSQSYGLNMTGIEWDTVNFSLSDFTYERDAIDKPSEALFMMDSLDFWVNRSQTLAYVGEIHVDETPAARHPNRTMNVMFLDGHSKAMSDVELDSAGNLWQVYD